MFSVVLKIYLRPWMTIKTKQRKLFKDILGKGEHLRKDVELCPWGQSRNWNMEN